MSSSITTKAMIARNRDAGESLRGDWLQDAEGRPSSDPKVLSEGGTLLPVGALDHGHKGYAMAILVECLSQGLSGYGRGSAEKRWGATVFVQVIQPELFAGSAAFAERSGKIA